MWLFKIAGLVLIFIAFSFLGFFKTVSLKKRAKKLKEIYRSMSVLREKIRTNQGEIVNLVKKSFPNNAVEIKDEKITAKSNEFLEEDKKLIDEFFSDVGMSDSIGEYERIGIYMSLILKKCEEADNKYLELGRLYSGIGVLSGIFICIFFL